MRPTKKALALSLICLLALIACGQNTPTDSPSPSTETPVLTQTLAPQPTKTPAASPTLEETVNPNAVLTGGMVKVGLLKEPIYISPLLESGKNGDLASKFIVEGLVDVGADGAFQPVLAEELPSLSEDGLVITYTLKTGVKFSNGDPLTCADVRFTWKAVMSYYTQTSKAGYELIQSVDCPDDHTAVVKMSGPYYAYLQLFNFIVPQAAGNPDALRTWEYHTAPIGTGPWKVFEWHIGDYILLAKNPYYREAGKPYADYLMLKFIDSDNTALEMLASGELDVYEGLNEGSVESLAGLAGQGVAYQAVPSGANMLLILNLADPKVDTPLDAVANPHPVLGDLAVRQAVQLGIDRQALVNVLPDGVVEPSASAMPSGYFGCPRGPGEYDPERAKALLDEAGWVTGTDGVREKDGVRLSMRITAPAENLLNQQIETTLVDQLGAIGVELVVENYPSREYSANWRSKGLRPHGQFDILLQASSTTGYPFMPLRGDYHSARIPTAYNGGRGSNFSRYKSSDVDDWIDAIAGTADVDALRELYCNIVQQINADVPVVFLYERAWVAGYRQALQNLQLSPGPASIALGSENWWIRP